MQNFKKQKGLKFTHLNIRSLWKHFDEVRILLNENSTHCATFSETWLTNQLPTSMINIPGYIMYRLDREVLNREGTVKIGGGVCMYIKSNIEVDTNIFQEYCKSNADMEIQWLPLKPQNQKKIIIGNAYRPPNSNIMTFNKCLLEQVEMIQNLSKSEIFLMCDFNINLLADSEGALDLVQNMSSCNLKQLIDVPTRFTTRNAATLIDHIYTDSDMISGSGTLDFNISDHEMVFAIRKKPQTLSVAMKKNAVWPFQVCQQSLFY